MTGRAAGSVRRVGNQLTLLIRPGSADEARAVTAAATEDLTATTGTWDVQNVLPFLWVGLVPTATDIGDDLGHQSKYIAGVIVGVAGGRLHEPVRFTRFRLETCHSAFQHF